MSETAQNLNDRAGKVRPSEELDAARVADFLRRQGVELPGEPEIAQFAGGASNLTYLLRFADRDLILRRPPFGQRAGTAHDMVREARVMQALRPVYPYVPRIIAICEDEAVLGCPFYVMERLDGIILRRDLPAGMELAPEAATALCHAMLDRLVDLHQVDWQAAGLEQLGKGAGYVARQLAGWSQRFAAAQTDDVPGCEDVIQWLQQHAPAQDAATTLIHNDWRFDNLVLDPQQPERIIGVLDWEMATLGDPLMDLGNALAYWAQADDDPVFLSMRQQPTHLPGMLTRAEVVRAYGERMGLDVSNFAFYEVFGVFRLAVIVQQIWHRYRSGHTQNPKFAQFGQVAAFLLQRCRKLIRRTAA